MCEKEKNAYMTIEASLIIPFILGGIVFIIYLGLYLYNACVMKQAAYIAVLRGSQLTDASSGEVEIYVEQQLEKLLENQILARENIRQEIKVSAHKVKIGLNTDIKMPFAEFTSSVTELWKIKSEAEASRVNPVEIIRNVRKINESQISK